jgi:putative FmdB family regulatory protein
MPLYEYQCEKCGDVFEVMQKFADEPLKVHVKCGGSVHRLLSAPALQFKGTGWYITDYAKGGAAAKGDGAAKTGESDSGKSTGADSAPKTAGDSSSAPKSDSPATTSKPSSSSSDTK